MLAFHKCISGDEPSIGTNCALKSDLRKCKKIVYAITLVVESLVGITTLRVESIEKCYNRMN